MGGVGRRYFDHHQRIADRIEAGASVLFGYFYPHKAQFTRLANGFCREFPTNIKGRGNRGYFVLRKFPGGFLDQLLLFS